MDDLARALRKLAEAIESDCSLAAMYCYRCAGNLALQQTTTEQAELLRRLGLANLTHARLHMREANRALEPYLRRGAREQMPLEFAPSPQLTLPAA